MSRKRNEKYRPLKEEEEKFIPAPPVGIPLTAEESPVDNESVLNKVSVNVRFTDHATDEKAVEASQDDDTTSGEDMPAPEKILSAPEVLEPVAEELSADVIAPISHADVNSDLLELKSHVPLSTIIEQLPHGEEPAMTSDTVPLVNPAQNITSDANIKAWETNEPSGTNLMYPILVSVLERYENEMRARKPMTAQEGAQHQEVLYQTLIRVAQTRVGFRQNWKYILDQFHKNNNEVYSIKYVMRFLDKMKVTKQDVVLFRQLLNLIINTCDPTDMVANLRRVSLEKTLAGVSSTNIRNNIMNYYRPFVN